MPYTIHAYALQCRHLIPTLNARADRAFTTARQIASQFPGHGCMNAWMTSQLNAALIRKLRGSLVCLAYFSDVIQKCLYKQELADVRSTVAGIKCLHCIVN